MPTALEIKLHPNYRHIVFGSPNDVFRIVFNLAHNAVMLALSGEITLLDFRLEGVKGLTLLQITDNGPGLSLEARKQLFRPPFAPNSGATNGHGLLIARELAERNGGTLVLAEVPAGTQFVLALSSLTAVNASTGPSAECLVGSASQH
jgi:signal transduction histidine kinase